MFKLILFAAAVSCAIVSAAFASERVLTPTFPETCKLTRSAPETSNYECPGPGGYSLWLAEVDQFDQVTFSQHEPKNAREEDGLSWLVAEIGIGGEVEWHTTNGVAYAAILDTWRRADDGDRAVEEILIAKIAPMRSCRVGTVDAHLPDAMNVARRIADTMAERFQCGRDKPIIQAGPSGAGAATFPAREALDHNGSIMTLTRLAANSVAIQYEVPRSKLPIAHGAVVFRGQSDGKGHVSGTAYTFKPGCEPAPYKVQGEWAAGVLTLTGAAPRRDRQSCKIVGYADNSANARLVFYHDAVLDFQ